MSKSKSWFGLLAFLGRPTIIFLLLGFAGSLALGAVELIIAGFLQLFLLSLGLVHEKIEFFGYPLVVMPIWKITIVLVVIGALRMIFQIIANQSSFYSGEIFSTRMKCLFVRDFIFSLTNQNQTISDVNYYISEIIPKSGTLVNSATQLISQTLQCSVILGAMFMATTRESLLAIFGIASIAAIVWMTSQKIKSLTELIPSESREVARKLEKVSRNLLLFKILRTKNKEYSELTSHLLSLANYYIRSQFLASIAGSMSPFLGILMITCIIAVSHHVWHTAPLVLLSFLYLLTRFIQNLATLSTQFSTVQMYRTQFKLAFRYYNDYPKDDVQGVDNHVMRVVFAGRKHKTYCGNDTKSQFNVSTNSQVESVSIASMGISFRYPQSRENILNNLVFSVQPGEQFGIIGKSGSGKSTLLTLLLGLNQPTDGKLLINGVNSASFFAQKSIRVGYVGAEPYLVKGTLKDNLIYGNHRTNISDSEIYNALVQAQLKGFIERVGLDYQINEDLTGLSAGQKQRLCMARALLNDPQLLVLDEASANLDEKTEFEIADVLSHLKGRCTTIIVSHRKGILKNADNILTLDEKSMVHIKSSRSKGTIEVQSD